MPDLTIRFDFRNPPFAGTAMHERYQAALEMAEWAERLGFSMAGVSEHHGVEDGYLPSPCVIAAAIAARTSRIRIRLGAVIAPVHDPLRLAEDLAVLDNLAEGRLTVMLVNGYVPSEYAMFDYAARDRAPRTEELVSTLRGAWSGDPFEFRGRSVCVTPAPHRPGGPPITLGGQSDAAARRAARIADAFVPANPACWDAYRDELRLLGRPDPGPTPPNMGFFFHVTNDPDAAWTTIAPYALYEMNAYGKWLAEADLVHAESYAPTEDADALRRTGLYRTITPEDLVNEVAKMPAADSLIFHPLMGGIPPTLAWESLHLFEHEALPALKDRGLLTAR